MGLGLFFVGLGLRILRYVALLLVLLDCAFFIAHFDAFSRICPAKLINTKTYGKYELKTLILCFGIDICLFYQNVGSKNYELSTANKLPHT